MADTPKHSVSVAGIVVDDQDRVLVIQRRDNGHWEPPGGVLELMETPGEGVVREVLEETGFRVSVGPLTGVYKNMRAGVVALVFRCEPCLGAGRSTTSESTSVRWVTRADVGELMDEAYSIRVEDAFSASAVMRVHDGVNLVEPMSAEP